jgi:hypothetical protein
MGSETFNGEGVVGVLAMSLRKPGSKNGGGIDEKVQNRRYVF